MIGILLDTISQAGRAGSCSAQEGSEILASDLLILRGEQHLPQDIRELTNIAGPAVVDQSLRGARAESPPDAFLPTDRVEKMLNQQGDVRPPLAQRRQVDADHIQTIEEIRSKDALSHQVLEVRIRGADDPRIDRKAVPSADRSNDSFLQGTQELALHVFRHVADLVKEEHSLVRRGEQALTIFVGPGEGALYMPEELALEQGLRDGAAIL